MKFIENNIYTLQTDYYNSVKVVCTYVEDNTVWFVYHQYDTLNDGPTLMVNYKLNRKTNKLYILNTEYQSWDRIENTLSEETVEDVWSKRMGNGSDYYSGIGQD